jgi:hypothetical protein
MPIKKKDRSGPMKLIFHENQNIKITEVQSNDIVIDTTQDMLDLMVDIDYQGARRIILYEKNIRPDFFQLNTGLAGEILQKVVNYNMKLAIVGNFEEIVNQSLRSFIYESNRGHHIFFLQDIETAKRQLLSVS